jgi:hypothetical protein
MISREIIPPSSTVTVLWMHHFIVPFSYNTNRYAPTVEIEELETI